MGQKVGQKVGQRKIGDKEKSLSYCNLGTLLLA